MKPLVTLLVFLVSHTVASSHMYQRVYEDKDVTLNSSPIVNAKLSQIRCGSWCSLTTECKAFTWDTLDQQCTLYPSSRVTFTTSSGTLNTLHIYASQPPTAGWTLHASGFSYRVIPFNGLWADGRDLCVAEGGKLGYINDAELLKNIRVAAGVVAMYLGLSREDDASPWHDEDGVQYSSIPWSPTSLNEPDPGQHCTIIYFTLANVYCPSPWDVAVFCML